MNFGSSYVTYRYRDKAFEDSATRMDFWKVEALKEFVLVGCLLF